MWHYILKVAVTSVVVVIVAETAKRNTIMAALVASLPLTSLLVFVWLYADTRNVERIASLSQSIFWLVIPSLALFLILPTLLRFGLNFWISLSASCAVTALLYFAMVWILGRFGIRV